MYNNHRQQDFLWGALIGGSIATLSALLFTTKKGKQIQKQISELYDDIEDTVKESFTDGKDTVKATFSDAKDKVKDAASHAKDKAKETAEDVKDSADHMGRKAAHKMKEDDTK